MGLDTPNMASDRELKRKLTGNGIIDWSEKGVLHLWPHGCCQAHLRHHATERALGISQQLHPLFR